MNKYVLLRSNTTGQIVIIDNNNHIGMKKVENLCMIGYTPAGTIESELPAIVLRSGFTADCRESLRIRERMITKIYDTVDELYTMGEEEFKEKYEYEQDY